jgi:hypothetical protein
MTSALTAFEFSEESRATIIVLRISDVLLENAEGAG